MSAIDLVFRKRGLAVSITKTKHVMVECSTKNSVLSREDGEELAFAILRGLGYHLTHPNAGNVDFTVEGPSYHGQPTDEVP